MAKPTAPDIDALNRRLLRIATRLERRAQGSVLSESVGGWIVASLYRKAINTFKAIELLKRRGFVEEGWILTRVLLEVTVNVLYFLKNNPAEMAKRYVDAMALENMKRTRAADFYQGTRLAKYFDRAALEKEDSEIRARYTPRQIEDMKARGFTGLSFEARAKDVDLGGMYSYYRLASRNMHSFDPADARRFGRVIGVRTGVQRELLKNRRIELDVTQNDLLGRLTCVISGFVDHKPDEELLQIIEGYKAYCESVWGTKAIPVD